MSAIRFARPEDAPALARLRYEFRAALGDASEPDRDFLPRCEAWMASRLLPAARWRCWVFELAGAVAGNLWLQVIEKVPNPVPELEAHAYITSVYVRPEARGHGAGEALVAAAMEWCRANGIDSAILWPTGASRTLYARHGFAVRDDLMEAIVNPGRNLHGNL
jgi:GNAT superfamily N-acetyltransferase